MILNNIPSRNNNFLIILIVLNRLIKHPLEGGIYFDIHTFDKSNPIILVDRLRLIRKNKPKNHSFYGMVFRFFVVQCCWHEKNFSLSEFKLLKVKLSSLTLLRINVGLLDFPLYSRIVSTTNGSSVL